MKAILQDFWRKNEENQAEIGRLQQKEVENQGETMRLRQEIDERENHETSIESELDARSNIIEELERKNNEQEKQKSELERQNCELDRKYSELLVMYSECQRKNGMLESEIEEQKPSCPVCLLNFDTEAHQPYALSCPHMVCAHCLDQARDSRNSQGRFLRSSRQTGQEILCFSTSLSSLVFFLCHSLSKM